MIFKTKMKRTLHLNDDFYWFIHFQKELYEKYTKMDLRNEKKVVLFCTILETEKLAIIKSLIIIEIFEMVF